MNWPSFWLGVGTGMLVVFCACVTACALLIRRSDSPAMPDKIEPRNWPDRDDFGEFV